MISLGTGAIYLSMHDSYAPVMIDTIHNFAHCLSDKWYHMAALLTCGSAIAWACSITGITTQMAMAELETRQHEPSNVVFLPYLDGVRTPHGNSQARGVFLGLDRAVSGIDLIQAVVEGVTFALADAGQALSSEGDTDASPLLLGGGAKSLYWAKLIATVLGRPVRRAVDAEAGSALGAARLAMIGSGVGSVQEVCYSPHSEAIDPISNLSEQYRQRLQEFRSMYFASETFSRFPRS
ncbi:hypothetical protein LP421_33860 (plasmid) [Rhizobium sp. RCAM05350]|uniref:FGGY-family carbohydrate kinase n=1 Tax=Rhizobium sp. RCAM05350 TaxID=2895568 RepID=UPI002076B05F|nr:FGGY-family carbohydrate kinase [Rhizobium sp. RCAM05350]URK89400.1 hypothetical protein LP421_33860 [Rhizobium sp. RCAM05350]